MQSGGNHDSGTMLDAGGVHELDYSREGAMVSRFLRHDVGPEEKKHRQREGGRDVRGQAGPVAQRQKSEKDRLVIVFILLYLNNVNCRPLLVDWTTLIVDIA